MPFYFTGITSRNWEKPLGGERGDGLDAPGPTPLRAPRAGSASRSPQKYSRQAAYGYAYKWWAGRNPHYNDYSASGGD